MTYSRVVNRNHLGGDYGSVEFPAEIRRHFSQEKYPGKDNLDAVLMEALWANTTHEKLAALSRIPSVAQTIEYYKTRPDVDGGVKAMAIRLLLDAVGSATSENLRTAIAGDLRRMERDQLDANFLPAYAAHAGVTEEQARIVLTDFLTFFGGNGPSYRSDEPIVQP